MYELSKIARRRRAVTLRPIRVTRTLERELFNIIRAVPDYWRKEARETVLPLYAREIDGLTRDDAADNLQSALEGVADGASRLAVSLTPALRSWVVRIERWHRGRWVSGVRQGANADVSSLLDDLAAAPEVKAHQEWAAGLIRDMSEDMRRRVEGSVFRAIADRTDLDAVQKELREAADIGSRRAKFIASDQANKLGGKLDELRHREAGITQYRWETALDDRVRPTHAANQGKVFDWSKPPAATGHPRSEPRCRCTAQAYVPLLEEIEAEL